MKKNFIEIFIIALIAIFACCNTSRHVPQEAEYPCEKLDRHLIDHYRDSILIDYVVRKNPRLMAHTISRNKLLPLNLTTCSNTLITANNVVNGKKVEIKISSTTIDLNEGNLEYAEISDDYPKFIDKVNGNAAYGLFSDEKIVTSIDEFYIRFEDKKILLDKSEYSNLFYPNFCNTFKAIQPLGIYKSKDEKFIYIYIFGANGLNRKPSSLNEVRSYMAKFIFSIENGYIGKIVLSNAELNAFQWDCSNFIGI